VPPTREIFPARAGRVKSNEAARAVPKVTSDRAFMW
jgi:hypothetical protein